MTLFKGKTFVGVKRIIVNIAIIDYKKTTSSILQGGIEEVDDRFFSILLLDFYDNPAIV